MDNANPPPRYTDKEGIDDNTHIDSDSVLLIEDGLVVDRSLRKGDLGKLGIAGEEGKLTVRIYDMQYDPEKVRQSGRMLWIPPSLTLRGSKGEIVIGDALAPEEAEIAPEGESANVGVYLLRASIEIDGRVTNLDSSVMQANKL
jgi:hypothetical protein